MDSLPPLNATCLAPPLLNLRQSPDTALATIAFVSTAPPQRCGLATFTADLRQAVQDAAPALDCMTIAMQDRPARDAIVMQDRSSYIAMARSLNRAAVDLLSVQHEYGIYGGADGEMLLDLLDRVAAPVVATLHTVLDRPSDHQRQVMDAIVARAARIVVMTEHSAAIMRTVHRVPEAKLRLIPHGIPAPSPNGRAMGRQMLGAGTRKLLLTFGLLSPGKGIEHAVRALPAIVQRHPDVLYAVLGVTHPNLVQEQGEAYRDSLQALAKRLGVARNITFVNRYVDLPELTCALAAADIYLTPYLNEAQSVSGTLAYSYGMGTPVVSTPYRHAAELLADGRGSLVPFADAGAIAAAVTALLDDPAKHASMRQRSRRAGLEMAWPRVGARYLETFAEAVSGPAVMA